MQRKISFGILNYPIRCLGIIIGFILLNSQNPTTAQQFVYQNFTTDDGLPSSECYDVIQDEKGYIWIATDKGIAKYNGQEFKVFDLNDGLKSSVIFRLFPKNGRIWFITYNKYIQYIENDQVVTPNYSTKLRDLIDSIYGVPENISINSNNEVLIALKFVNPPYNYIVVDTFGNLNLMNYPTKYKNSIVLIHRSGHVPVWTNYKEDYGLKNSKLVFLQMFGDKPEEYVMLKENAFGDINLRRISVLEESDSGSYSILSAGETLYVVSKNQKKDSIQVSGLVKGALFKYAEHQYAYGRRGKPLLTFKMKNGVLSDVDSSNFEMTSISGGSLDSENGLWITSLTEGVFYVKNPRISSLQNLVGKTNVIGLATLKDEIWAAMNNYNLYAFDKNSFSLTKHLEFKSEIWAINSIKEQLLVVSSMKYDTILDGVIRLKNARKGLHHENDSTWYAETGQIHLEVNGQTVYRNLFDGSNDLYTAAYKSGKWLYLGNNYGLSKYNINKEHLTKEKEVNSSINIRINEITSFKNYLLLATNGSGLYVINDNDSVVAIVNSSRGLSSNFCNSIYQANDSTYWISTNKGVSRIIFQIQSDSISYSVQVFNKSHGLISDEVSSCLIENGKLVIGTKKGLCFLDLKGEYLNKVAPQVFIEFLTVNDSIIESQKLGVFNHDQNTLRFFFVGLTFKTEKKLNFKYRLTHGGQEQEFVPINRSDVQFTGLNPGDYKFEVIALNNDHVESLKSAKYEFTILPAWWNTWWFRSLYISCFILIIYSFFRYRYNQKKTRDELGLTTKKLKQKALNAQLNPHFIFNTMGSIQSLIIDEKLPEAEGYLTKFSKMLRTILSSSDEHFINLKNELELVTEYVKLENLRFDNRIDLKLNVEGVTSGNIFQAPTLLILTLVENAILHGILPSKKSGRIEITTRIDSKDSSRLQIIIEDNGIGILQSKEIKKSKIHSHKSMGLNIIKDRLETYSSLYKGSFSIQFIDLSTLEEDKTGTRVEIFTPYKIE